MLKKKRLVVLIALLVFTAISSPSAAKKARFNQFIGFGDSTLDSGYFRYNSSGNPAIDQAVAAAVAGGAMGGWAGPGVMTSTILAGMFGLSAAPIGGGGTNYAVGASYTTMASPGLVSATQQITNYLAATGGIANPNALYVIQTGNNDLIYVTNQGTAWIAANPNYLHEQALALAASVATLQAAGARNIVVPNTFFTATLAGPGGVVPASNADAYARAVAFSADRWATLTAAGVRFIPADLTSVFQFVVQHPTLFGFTAASVLSANAPSPVAALLTTWANITPEQMQTYLFIDGHHLTTAGQRIEADYENSLIVAPTQVSMLAESAIQGGLARAATIQGQIDLSGQHRGPNGINVWASAGANALDFKNDTGFPDASGSQFTGSAGADYQLPCGVIIGAAFTAGKQTQEFSANGGHYDQVDEALSLYAAYKAGPVWANAVASYGLYQDKIKRQVALGLFLDQNSADTNGYALALALRAGGDIKLGPVTTGPVAGMVLQQARIEGFTETGTSGVTALSFARQTRDSAVSQLGWRVLVDVGKWQPFAEAKWNHELVEQDRKVKAALTTAPAAPYSVDAAPTASDWATASIGTSYKLSPRVMLRGVASAMLANPQVVNYGGELGVSVNF